MISVLAKDRVFLDYGPIEMMLMATSPQMSMISQMQEAAQEAIIWLNRLSQVLDQAKDVRTLNHPRLTELPLPLRWMVEAVLATGDRSLTPMAAVAGTFSDLVADRLVEAGAHKVIINNGGDIAIRLIGSEQTKVGVTPSIGANQFTHVIELSSSKGIGGVATSGRGGRSFTKGIASSATVLAETARVADSCATLVANHCFAPDPNIFQLPAEKLDPQTDIPGHYVTVKVGELNQEVKRKALENALVKVKELENKGIIQGAVVFLDELVGMIPDDLCYPVK
ncbi:UPF0280 family protein [Desulfitobacterium sp.]|uniref:UPF0280 family protein n=1 Tax=Desulfitobacterium sp. TaxID=49981 RepID=UPI002B8D5EBE|nr:UPF0280 family protein [Desulfitobacterium sp.]HVJ49172.1 UPF0280 family protein [Desulfitobacterium sp.]